MTDIVERLQAKKRNATDEEEDALDEILLLRQQLGDVFDEKKILSQRVKDQALLFEKTHIQLRSEVFKLNLKFAALKQSQGEPVAVAHVGNRTFYVTANPRQLEKLGFSCEDSFDIPLYTSAPTIPEGWQIVPIEPTNEQTWAGRQENGLRNAYSAMVRAAPKPEDVK